MLKLVEHELTTMLLKVKPSTDSNATWYGYYIGGTPSLPAVTKNKKATSELVTKQQQFPLTLGS
jgi:hypothetical protein